MPRVPSLEFLDADNHFVREPAMSPHGFFFDPLKALAIEVVGIDFVPKPVKQLSRHWLLEFKSKSFAIAVDPQLKRIWLSQRLNVRPAPTAPALSICCQVIDPVRAEVQGSVGPSCEGAVPCGDCGKACCSGIGVCVSYWFCNTTRQFGGNIRRHRHAQIETIFSFAMAMPATVLVSGNDEAVRTQEIKCLDLQKRPVKSRAFGWMEYQTVLA